MKVSLHVAIAVLLITIAETVLAHGVADRNQGFLATATGFHPFPYLYLGAKHMVTGYDHLLYLAGVIFYLSRFREIAAYVSLFALGHSLTLLYGVLSGTLISPFLVDAIIGLSVAYKALENLKFISWVNPKTAVFVFGLVHGFGLSTKLQDLALSRDGLVANMIAFNVGVEIGQILALLMLFAMLSWLRRLPSYSTIAENTNVILFGAGILLFGFHTVGYFVT